MGAHTPTFAEEESQLITVHMPKVLVITASGKISVLTDLAYYHGYVSRNTEFLMDGKGALQQIVKAFIIGNRIGKYFAILPFFLL